MSKEKEPVILWRQQVDDRIWFEAIEDDWSDMGRFVFLYCRAKHHDVPGQMLQYQQVFPADEWAALYNSEGYLRTVKDQMLHHIRYALADADASEIQQELTATVKAIMLRMFFDDSHFFREMQIQAFRQIDPRLADIEHRIFEDARIPPEDHASWPAFCLPQRLTIEEMKLFKRIADEARNWFTWSEKAETYQFLPMPAWVKLHREWRKNNHGPEYWSFT